MKMDEEFNFVNNIFCEQYIHPYWGEWLYLKINEKFNFMLNNKELIYAKKWTKNLISWIIRWTIIYKNRGKI